MTLLERYNQAYNNECAALPSGGPISMEHLQAITLVSLLKATGKRRDWDIPYENVVELIEALYEQGNRNG
jgi:hypothetical protein